MYRIATIICTIAVIVGLTASPTSATSKTFPQCEVNGAGSLKVNISLCTQASYKNVAGKREDWRRVLLGIGMGGRWLEEANGAVIRNLTVQKPNGDYVLNQWWFNLFEYQEDRYRRIFDIPGKVRARYLKVCVRGDGDGKEDRGYELRVDHGGNRFGEFCFRLNP